MRAVLNLPAIDDDAADASEVNAFFVLLRQALQSAGVAVLSPDSVQPALDTTESSGPGLPDIWLTVGWTGSGEDSDAALAAGIPWALAVPDACQPEELAANADAIQRACAVVVIGSGSAHAVAPHTYDRRIVQLAPFIDTAPYSAAYPVRDQHKAAIASRLQLPLASRWLLVLTPSKREATLESFTMLARACSRLAMLDWYLVVAGEDDTLDDMRALLRTLPEHRLRFWPSLSPQERTRLCVSCDFLLWPAVGDMGLQGLLEAQAAGMPVVACSSDRVRERVHDGVTGRLAKTDNAESLANHAAFFLRHPAFIRSCGAQAREMALNDHDVRLQGKRLRQALERVMEAGAD